jgi:TRAP-type C4-dicarboxylate transport system permease small subunit
MVDSMGGILKKIFSITDILAGICFFFFFFLVLANIIMRYVFGQPITGTLDYVCLLSVTGIGLALANCAMNDGNIAMSIVTDYLPSKIKQILEIAVCLISLGFWILVGGRMYIYGITLKSLERVSPTAMAPLYPFILILTFSFLCLCLVLAFKLTYSVASTVILFRRRSGNFKQEEGKVSK